MTLLSAHRGGAGINHARENTRELLEAACSIDCEYVEFDVQRLGDGTFVLFHDDFIASAGVRVPLANLTKAEFEDLTTAFVLYEEALGILRGHKKAHIDLKFLSPPGLLEHPSATWEVAATRLALDILGADNMIITTLEDESVRAIRTWASNLTPMLLVGLSLGRDIAGLSRLVVIKIRFSELFPRARIRRCGANLVVANKTLARLTLARFAQRRGLPLLVWTVDDATELRYWLKSDRAWLVTTNVPLSALELRESIAVATG